MKMKKSQIKEAIKMVVRECLNERALKEVSPPGAKAERMIHHVKASLRKSHPDWSEDKVKSVAIATGWKAHNAGSVEQNEQVGADVVAGEGAKSSDESLMDKVVKVILQRAPAIAGNPDKVAQVAGLLYQRQTQEPPPDHDSIMAVVQKHMKVSDTPARPTAEAGLTSENGEEGYDEKEEIMLIKVMELIAKKLSAMHSSHELVAKQGAEEPSAEIPASQPEEPEEPEHEEEPEEPEHEEPEAPFGGEEEPEEPEHEEEPEEPEHEEEPEDSEELEESTQTLPPNKGSYKVVAQPSSTDEEENKALNIQTDPEVNEAKDKWIQKAVDPAHKGYCTPMTKKTCTPRRKALAKRFKKGIDETNVNMKMGPSYKVAPNPTARVTEPDQPARLSQFVPKMTENHKTQKRSYKTVNDQASDPANVRDPDVPTA